MPKRAIAVLSVLILLSTCWGCLAQPAQPTPTSAPEVEEVTLSLESGEKVYALRYGSGDPALILVHMFTYNASQQDWKRFARLAADGGFTVLTIDVPGFGKTPGDPAVPLWEESVLAAAGYLEGLGHDRIACLGACSGGTTCMLVSAEFEFAALGLLSAEIPGDDYDYSILTMPKFFASTEEEYDGEFADAMKLMYDSSPDPREMLLLPGDAHGTDIFNTYYGTELAENILGFLQSIQ